MNQPFTFLLPHFPPDVAADGQLFSLLARELVREGHDVRVLTWRPGYQEMELAAPRRETRDGVRIRRLWAPRFRKRGLAARAFAALWMGSGALWRLLWHPRKRTVILPSSPPTFGLAAWAMFWLKRQRYLYVLHDIHPDLGIKLGRFREKGLLARLLRLTGRLVMRRAARVATISAGMAENARRIQPAARIEVIENWADLEAIRPIPKQESRFAAEQGLVEPFVVQYSGNLGLLHPLDGLTRACGGLAAEGAVLTYIGRGARLGPTRELAAREGLTNVRFFDYRPFAELADSLSACDVAVVAFEAGIDGLAMPSKLVGILASGRPILALAEEGSEIARLVEESGVGVVVARPDDAEAVREALLALLRDEPLRRAMGEKARRLAEERFSLKVASGLYAQTAAPKQKA